MVINMVVTSSLEYLNRGLQLELFATHELHMVFSYIRQLYQMVIYNRKPIVVGMNEDLLRLNLIDLNELSNSADKFKQKRRKSSSA